MSNVDVYQWVSGFNCAVDAATVQAEIDRLTAKHGGFQNNMLVEAARKKGHPLHELFVWDNSRAAESYRLGQAAQLVRSVRVVVRSKGTEVLARQNVRVAVRQADSDDKCTTVKPISQVVRNKQEYLQERNRILASLRRTERLLEALEILASKARAQKADKAPLIQARDHVKAAVDALAPVE